MRLGCIAEVSSNSGSPILAQGLQDESRLMEVDKSQSVTLPSSVFRSHFGTRKNNFSFNLLNGENLVWSGSRSNRAKR